MGSLQILKMCVMTVKVLITFIIGKVRLTTVIFFFQVTIRLLL